MKLIKYISLGFFALLIGTACNNDLDSIQTQEEMSIQSAIGSELLDNGPFYARLSPQKHDFPRNGGQTYIVVGTNGRIAGFHNTNKVNFDVTSPGGADMSLIKIVCTSDPGRYSTTVIITIINFEGEEVILEFPVTQGYY